LCKTDVDWVRHGQSAVVTCYTAGVDMAFTFCCDNLWKSKFTALEKPGKLREFFSPTLWPSCNNATEIANKQ